MHYNSFILASVNELIFLKLDSTTRKHLQESKSFPSDSKICIAVSVNEHQGLRSSSLCCNCGCLLAKS